MEFKNLKEVIKYLEKINEGEPNKYYLDYNIQEGSVSLEWYQAILEQVKKYNPKRVVDIGSNLNMFGFIFANEGIEYIGIEKYKENLPVETDMIKFINADYYDVKEQFKDDIIISCLCVGYLIPIKDVLGKVLIVNHDNGTAQNYKCTAKEINIGGNHE